MNLTGKIKEVIKERNGIYLKIFIPGAEAKIKNHQGVEIRLDDEKKITAEQRKKAYATLKDISDHTGHSIEESKEWMKYHFLSQTGSEYFSLSDCSMLTAREFISFMLEYALESGIPLSDNALNRTDDIERYLYHCIKHKKCCICGRDGEIHHADAIGMGRDRQQVDDSECRKICLCRKHHTIAHQRGRESFEQMYHVYGIKAPTKL